MKIATHDGSFHADETIACAILTYLYDNAQIIRSRDLDLLETADIIIDVSGKNDHKHFDHHCRDFKEGRENGILFATAGLMWHKFGIQFLEKIYEDHIRNKNNSFILSDYVLNKAFSRIDREIMYMVDLNDNGQLNSYIDDKIVTKDSDDAIETKEALNEFYQIEPSIPYIVAMFNLPNTNNQEQYKNFISVIKILKNILINASINALYTEYGITKVLDAYDGGKLLIIHEKLPWSQAVLSNLEIFKDCYLCIYPDRKRGFRIQSLPISRSKIFVNKLSAPIAWRGLDNDALDKASGLNGTIFVHKAGFTGGAESFETTIKMAKLWLKDGVYNS